MNVLCPWPTCDCQSPAEARLAEIEADAAQIRASFAIAAGRERDHLRHLPYDKGIAALARLLARLKEHEERHERLNALLAELRPDGSAYHDRAWVEALEQFRAEEATYVARSGGEPDAS